MNVTCPSCPAKYVVPDAKIRGRRLRMVCKHCGRPFVVDGTGLEAEHPDPTMAPVWVVMVNDRDATQMSARQLVELYAIGAIHSRTTVWRVGTSECRTPFEFPELGAALTARGFVPTTVVDRQRSFGAIDQSDDATVVGYPVAQGGFARGAYSPDEDDEFDDEATVAVPRGTALAHYLDDGWGSEGSDAAEDERTVTGDPRAFAARAANYDDDDAELGVARLPSELEGREQQISILIAPDSGEESAHTGRASQPWQAQPQRPDGVAPSGAAARRWADSGGALAGAPLRAPLPAAGSPAVAPRAPLPAAGTPATYPYAAPAAWDRGSSRPPPPAEVPSRPSQRPPAPAHGFAEGRSAAPVHTRLAPSEPRIPPPPAVIPPPPVTGAPATPRSSRPSVPSGSGYAASHAAAMGPDSAPRSSSRASAADASAGHPGRAMPLQPSSRTRPGPAAEPVDELDDDLFAPRRRRARNRARLLRALLLVALAVPSVLAGVYAYDRSLLVAAFPDLPRLLPALCPAPPPPPSPVPLPSAGRVAPAAHPTTTPAPSTSVSAAPLAAFDRREAVAALAIAAESARVCFDPAAHIYGGMVIATFAPSGRIAKVDLRGPLASTAVGDCVAQTFERVTIPPFAGDPVPVAQQVSLK